jgi:hypothetical protein
MNRSALHIFIALLTFIIGIAAYVYWKSPDEVSHNLSNQSMTLFIVEPATSKDTALFDWEAYQNEHCIRRNPEREKQLIESLNRESRKPKR